MAAAERRLAAQTARTGVATADLFPRVSVTGFVGFLSGDLGSLGGDASRMWSIAPAVSWPARDFGSAQARLRAQKARRDAALAVYEQTVLLALEDVQNAIVAYAQTQERGASLGRRSAASRWLGGAGRDANGGEVDHRPPSPVLDPARGKLGART